jgi:hypothetical protein
LIRLEDRGKSDAGCQLGGRAKGNAAKAAKAAKRAADLLPLILPMKAGGASLRQIADGLNRCGVPAAAAAGNGVLWPSGGYRTGRSRGGSLRFSAALPISTRARRRRRSHRGQQRRRSTELHSWHFPAARVLAREKPAGGHFEYRR